MTFMRTAHTARASLDIPVNVHGTWPQCAGTMSGRALCVRRGAGVHLGDAPLTPYPHYGLAFGLKKYGKRTVWRPETI